MVKVCNVEKKNIFKAMYHALVPVLLISLITLLRLTISKNPNCPDVFEELNCRLDLER